MTRAAILLLVLSACGSDPAMPVAPTVAQDAPHGSCNMTDWMHKPAAKPESYVHGVFIHFCFYGHVGTTPVDDPPMDGQRPICVSQVPEWVTADDGCEPRCRYSSDGENCDWWWN